MSVLCPTCNSELDLDEVRTDQHVTCFIDRAESSMPRHWLTTFGPSGIHSRGVGLKSTKLKET